MRKQCLFDSTHLIDQFGYGKHLKNCQSKLKKDWRQCKYQEQHWVLYKFIEFHQKFECPENPLCKKDSKAFQIRFQQQLLRMQSQKMRKKNKQYIFEQNSIQTSLINIDPAENQTVSMHQPHFDGISRIQGKNNKSINQRASCQVKNSQDHSLLWLKDALSLDDKTKNQKIVQTKAVKKKNALYNKQSSIPSQLKSSFQRTKNIQQSFINQTDWFQKGISEKVNKLWVQPDFPKFLKQYTKRWQQKKKKQKKQKQIIQQFEQQQAQLSMYDINYQSDKKEFAQD